MPRLPSILEQLTQPGQMFEVVNDTMFGRPVRTYANRPRNLRDLMGFRYAHAEREYLVQGEERLTFAEAFERALRLAAALRHDLGVAPGDRVGVVGANAPDWVVAYWAAVALQAVVVPFNAWWTSEELAFGLADSGTVAVVCDSRRATLAVEAGMRPSRVVVWGAGERPAGTRALEELLAADPLDEGAVPAADEDDTAVIFYTSGTTGRPKGSANTHRNVITNLMNAAVFVTAHRILTGTVDAASSPDVNLLVIPLFHATANLTYLVPYVFAGNKLVFMPPGPFDPEEAGRLIEREKVTTFGGVPTVVARMLDAGVQHRYDFSSVRTITYGGAPASPALVERIAAAFPHASTGVAQGYGLTETSAIVTVNLGEDYLEKPGSVGYPAPVCEVRIVDADGNPLPVGEAGEVWVWGPNVIPGYWNRPEANQTSFVEGWLRTGDIGYLDEDGFLYITDRAKDMIIRGGENVYCVEVEAVLDEHPAVREVAVVGVPHPEWGEEVKAVVVVDPDAAVTADELAAFAASRLARFKVPTHWELRSDPLPRNPSGKVLKSSLRGRPAGVFAVGDSDSAL